MQEENGGRIWSLQGMDGMATGPLEIRESQACFPTISKGDSWRLAAAATAPNARRYRVGDDQCLLELSWPKTSDDSVYRQVADYQVILTLNGRLTQLRDVSLR